MTKACFLCPSPPFPGAPTPLPAPALSSPPCSSSPILSLLLSTSHPCWWESLLCVLSPEVVCLPAGDLLPPPEALFARSCWKLGAGALECSVSWHVTPGPRCQIPEPWPGQEMPRQGRSWTLMSSAMGRPGPSSFLCPRLPSQGLDMAIFCPCSLRQG